jgi:gliding motility-associated protein GldC
MPDACYFCGMKKSTITFTVELDQQNVPERILWDATDKPDPGLTETKAISVALWDQSQKNTLRIDLWTKDMPVDDMKRFHVECLGGIAQTILSSTGDEFMANEIHALCERFVKHIQDEKR